MNPGGHLCRHDAVGFGSPNPPRLKELALQPLSPREIQARVRAGASPEAVSADTGWPLDRVIRYAEPPLGERAYVAEQARSVEISRSRGGLTLAESVSAILGVDPMDISWDAYRTDDARWIVTAHQEGRNVGTWTYETVGRTVHPQDESARALMGGGPSAVADAPPIPTEPAPAIAETTDHVAPEPAMPARPRLVSVTSDPTAPTDATAPIDTGDGDHAGHSQSAAEQDALLEESDISSGPQRAKRTKGKKGRASVPSWDEILFGASRPED